jgi:hypothetical protein
MAITYTVATASGTSGTPSITHGLTIADGDILIAVVHSNNNKTLTGLDGFTQQATGTVNGTSGTAFLLSKVASAAEPSSYTFTLNEGSERFSIVLYSIKGGNSASIFDVTPVGTESSGVQATATVSGITTTSANSLVITNVFQDSSAAIVYSAPSAGWTEDAQETGSQAAVAYSKVQASAGLVSDFSITCDASFAQDGWMFAINEGAAASGLTIDSTDASMQRNTNFQVVCSNPTTTPTTGNTTLTNGNDTLTPTSVTGSDPYTLTFPVGDLTKQVDAVGYDWTLEITPDEP